MLTYLKGSFPSDSAPDLSLLQPLCLQAKAGGESYKHSGTDDAESSRCVYTQRNRHNHCPYTLTQISTSTPPYPHTQPAGSGLTLWGRRPKNDFFHLREKPDFSRERCRAPEFDPLLPVRWTLGNAVFAAELREAQCSEVQGDPSLLLGPAHLGAATGGVRDLFPKRHSLKKLQGGAQKVLPLLRATDFSLPWSD